MTVRAAPTQKVAPHLPQVDKRAQINLSKIAASNEKAAGQYLNGPQRRKIDTQKLGKENQHSQNTNVHSLVLLQHAKYVVTTMDDPPPLHMMII